MPRVSPALVLVVGVPGGLPEEAVGEGEDRGPFTAPEPRRGVSLRLPPRGGVGLFVVRRAR